MQLHITDFIFYAAATLALPASMSALENSEVVQVCVTLELSPPVSTAIDPGINATIFSMDGNTSGGFLGLLLSYEALYRIFSCC